MVNITMNGPISKNGTQISALITDDQDKLYTVIPVQIGNDGTYSTGYEMLFTWLKTLSTG